jgi:chromosomal replication initiation ATPase DnaA
MEMASVINRKTRGKHPYIGTVTSVCSAINGLNIEDLLTKSRRRNFTVPRQLAMYIIRENSSNTISLVDIAAFFNRDHSTVIHACTFIEDMLRMNDKVIAPMYNEAIYRLTQLESEIDTLIDPHSHSALNLAAV